MSMVLSLVLVLQVLSAIGLIVLVLLQHGKGADMGAAFGSGASGSLFGATGSANFLSRTTAAMATVFFASTLALAFFGRSATSSAPRSVMEQGAPAQPSGIPAPVAPPKEGTGGPAGAAGADKPAPTDAPASSGDANPAKGSANNEIPK